MSPEWWDAFAVCCVALGLLVVLYLGLQAYFRWIW